MNSDQWVIQPAKTRYWKIFSLAGVELGTYPGASAGAAVAAMARAAGYEDQADAESVVGRWVGAVRPVGRPLARTRTRR